MRRVCFACGPPSVRDTRLVGDATFAAVVWYPPVAALSRSSIVRRDCSAAAHSLGSRSGSAAAVARSATASEAKHAPAPAPAPFDSPSGPIGMGEGSFSPASFSSNSLADSALAASSRSFADASMPTSCSDLACRSIGQGKREKGKKGNDNGC
jgi:hypothetical protein